MECAPCVLVGSRLSVQERELAIEVNYIKSFIDTPVFYFHLPCCALISLRTPAAPLFFFALTPSTANTSSP